MQSKQFIYFKTVYISLVQTEITFRKKPFQRKRTERKKSIGCSK